MAEHTTNADSFATLSEASFAEDWGSREDRVYDEPEARLAALLAANGPLPNEHYHALAAAALRLARALRDQGSELEGNWWHLKDCGAAYDWVHFQEVSGCDVMCAEAQKHLAEWDRLLRSLNGG